MSKISDIFFVLPLIFIFISCSEKVPVPENILILVYTDLMFAQDTLLVTTKNIDSLKSEVFARHKISEEDYQNTLNAINRTPERWEKFFERVIVYVESLRSKPVKQENISFWPLQFVKVQN